MAVVRTLARSVALTAWTAAVYGFLVATSFLVGLRPGSGGWRGPGTGPWRTAIFHGWARGVVRLLGVRAAVEGVPPRPPFFLVANHLGYLDVALIAAHLRCVFVARGDVDRWPVFGALCRAGDTLFIDRENRRDIPRVIDRIRAVLDGGRGVVLFPEGTSSGGEAVLPFKPGLLEPAAVAGIPVSYAAVSYATPPGSPPARLVVCWWGAMPFVRHLLTLLGLPEIRARLVFGAEPIVESERKELARRLHRAVSLQHRPTQA